MSVAYLPAECWNAILSRCDVMSVRMLKRTSQQLYALVKADDHVAKAAERAGDRHVKRSKYAYQKKGVWHSCFNTTTATKHHASRRHTILNASRNVGSVPCCRRLT